MYESSLVTFTAAILPSFSSGSKIDNKSKLKSNVDVDEYYQEVIDIFNAWEYSQGFRIRGVFNGTLSLDSDHRMECPIHNRIHEHDNAFVNVTENGNVFWHCCRSEKHEGGIFLGEF